MLKYIHMLLFDPYNIPMGRPRKYKNHRHGKWCPSPLDYQVSDWEDWVPTDLEERSRI